MSITCSQITTSFFQIGRHEGLMNRKTQSNRHSENGKHFYSLRLDFTFKSSSEEEDDLNVKSKRKE